MTPGSDGNGARTTQYNMNPAQRMMMQAKALKALRDKRRSDKAKVVQKFVTIQHLNSMQDAGGADGVAAGKAKRAMQNTWTNRTSNNVSGFLNSKAARKAAPVTVLKGSDCISK